MFFWRATGRQTFQKKWNNIKKWANPCRTGPRVLSNSLARDRPGFRPCRCSVGSDGPTQCPYLTWLLCSYFPQLGCSARTFHAQPTAQPCCVQSSALDLSMGGHFAWPCWCNPTHLRPHLLDLVLFSHRPSASLVSSCSSPSPTLASPPRPTCILCQCLLPMLTLACRSLNLFAHDLQLGHLTLAINFYIIDLIPF